MKFGCGNTQHPILAVGRTGGSPARLTYGPNPSTSLSRRVCDGAIFCDAAAKGSDIGYRSYGSVRLGRGENNWVERRDVRSLHGSIDVATPHSEQLIPPPRAGFQPISD